jgi:hypothetical protein
VGKIKYKGVEKRKFQRLDIPLNVNIRIVTNEEITGGISSQKVQSHNISQQGICLETAQIVVDSVNMLSGSPGARENSLEMEIELIPKETPIKARGEVCWYDIAQDADKFLYQVGIVFTEIHGSDKDRLAKFLRSRKKNRGFFESLLSLFHS